MNKNPQKIKEMFDNIAEKYDYNNNIISFGFHKRVKKAAVQYFNFSGKVLDLCTGTGDIAGFLGKNCEVTGVDFSEKMLQSARKKFPDIKFILADCTNLPFEDNSFDAVTISFGLRNIENYNKALDEIYRVLKPNGLFLHIDFGKKNFFADIIYDFLIPPLIKIFYGNDLPYKYLVQSKKMFFDDKKLIELFKNHSLIFEEQKNFLFGMISCQMCKKES